MPKQRSAFKELRKIKKRRVVNLARMSELKTLIKRFENLLRTKKTDEAKAYLHKLFSKIDSRAARGVIHKNAAARKKARLAKAVNASAKT